MDPAIPALLDPVVPVLVPVLLVDDVDDALPEPDPVWAFVSIHSPLLRVPEAVLPAVPLVPVVVADDPPPPVRQPVTVMLPVLLDRAL